MSETETQVVPAVVNVLDDGAVTVSGWRRFYEVVQQKLFGCAEEVLGSMADFQKELVKHLDEMTTLNGEIARSSADLAMKLSDFERDICHIRDYYDRIIASTKTAVDYGCDQHIIPHIRDLIEEKRYADAKTEIESFLFYLRKAIRRVEQDIEAMKQDCPNLEAVKTDIQQTISASDPTTAKRIEMQLSHGRVFKLGTSTLVYMMTGAATGLVVASCMPQEASKLTEVLTSAGSEALTFCTGSVVTGLRKAMDDANLAHELRKRAESNAIAVCHCLTGFFKQLNRFQSDINTVESTIDNLKQDMVGLQEDVDYKGAHTNTVPRWRYVGKVLQQMFESFTRLNTRVIEKPHEGFDKKDFDAIVERLTRSVDLTILGTPI